MEKQKASGTTVKSQRISSRHFSFKKGAMVNPKKKSATISPKNKDATPQRSKKIAASSSLAEQRKLKQNSSSNSPKQTNKTQTEKSEKGNKTMWWYSNKLGGRKDSEKQKSVDEKTKKPVSAIMANRQRVRISKKKALHLKKKRQKKTRRLQKRMHLTGDVQIPATLDDKTKKVTTAKSTKSKIGKVPDGRSTLLSKRGDQVTVKSSVSLKRKNADENVDMKGAKVKSRKKARVLQNGEEKDQKVHQSGSAQDEKAKEAAAESSQGQKVPKDEGSTRKVSANWLALLLDLEKNTKSVVKRIPSKKAAIKQSKPDIWFDGVDSALIEANENAGLDKGKDGDSGNNQSENTYNPLIRSDAQYCLTKCLAMDCEMVGIGPKGSESILARVSIVNQFGACVFDKFVTPREPVTDYRTFVSGIRPQDLKTKGESFEKVQKEVSDILKGRIVVGHAIYNDFKVLYFSHPRNLIRDTSLYLPFREMFKSRRPGLKKLTEAVLKVKVQKGEHNSVEDAQAAMKLYMVHRRQWERSLRSNITKPRKKPAKKVNPSLTLLKTAEEVTA